MKAFWLCLCIASLFFDAAETDVRIPGFLQNTLNKFIEADKNPPGLYGGGIEGNVNGLVGGIGGPERRPTTQPPIDDEPPPGPPGGPDEPPPNEGNQPICMDLVVVLDVSCSIDVDYRETSRKIAYDVISYFASDPATDMRVGLLTYDGRMSHKFYLNSFSSLEDVLDAIASADLEMDEPSCRTHSHIALSDVENDFFTEENGDRADTRNVVFFFTDGRTIQPKFRQRTIDAAERLKEAGTEIYLAALPNNRGKPTTEEFDLIPSSPIDEHFFDASDPLVVEKIVEIWIENHTPPNCGRREDDTFGCVDLLFLFDFSCSIDMVDREFSVNVSKQIIERIVIHPTRGANVAAFSFDDVIGNRRPATGMFSDPNGNLQFIDMLDSMDLAGSGCKTRTYQAFSEARNILTNDDRNDANYTDAVIIFSDGRTAPLHYRVQTLINAGVLKDDGALIAWVHLPSNRGDVKEEDGLTNEVLAVASYSLNNNQLAFESDDPGIVKAFEIWLNSRDFICPEQEENP